MKIHELKIEDKYFWEIALGKKTAEIRYNDRDYKVGDVICLKEIKTLQDKQIYTGHYVLVQITHIITAEEFKGLADNHVMLSFTALIQATNNVHDCSQYNADENEILDSISQYKTKGE